MSKNHRWLIGVTVLTLASGWIGVGAHRLLGEPDRMESPGSLIWLVTPLLLVLTVRLLRRADSPGGWHPHLREGWPMYLLAIVAFPAVTTVSLLLARLTGAADFGGFDIAVLGQAVTGALAVNLVKNVFEEAVWRGYFVGEFVTRRLPDWAIYVSAGLIWALWHLPYYLFLLPEADLRAVLDVPLGVFAAITIVVMIAWSVLFTEMYRFAGSIWPLVVLHAVEDAVVNPIVIDGHMVARPGLELLFSPVVGLVPAACYVAIGLGLRAWRLRRERDAALASASSSAEEFVVAA